MLISSSDFSVPKINHRIAGTPKQSTKPVVHGLQSTEELRLTNTEVRPGRGGFCSAAVDAVWGSALNASAESRLGSKAALCTGWHRLGNWGLSPCSPCLLPSHRAQDAAPRCLTPVLLLAVVGLRGHCQVTGVVLHMMREENFQLLAVNKVYAALGHFFPKGCQRALLLINVLSKWSLLFCLQNM